MYLIAPSANTATLKGVTAGVVHSSSLAGPLLEHSLNAAARSQDRPPTGPIGLGEVGATRRGNEAGMKALEVGDRVLYDGKAWRVRRRAHHALCREVGQDHAPGRAPGDAAARGAARQRAALQHLPAREQLGRGAAAWALEADHSLRGAARREEPAGGVSRLRSGFSSGGKRGFWARRSLTAAPRDLDCHRPRQR
jgi:hypothetical protein